VENVAEAISLAVSTDSVADRVYNVADPETITEAEWLQRIGGVFGWKGSVVSAPAEQLPESLRVDSFDLRQNFVVDSSRIRAELGYREIVDEEEALRRTIDWELAHPPASSDDPFDYESEDRALAVANERT
jgi:nucleoside-diphosphate-sugar epimerase